tara:strand:+ start:53 stop:232 length:180 start_codon:yes stop_codon:yes gene_type:complete
MYKNQSDIRKKILDELFEINSDFIVDAADGRGAATNKNKTTRINKALTTLIDELEEDEA